MAPHPGADSFIASVSKAASARVLLALAAALLLLGLAGCGGGGSDATTASTSSDGTSASAPSQSTEKAHPSAPQGKEGAPSQDSTKQGDPQAKPAGSGEGKQGPRVSLPKGSPEPEPTPQQRAESTLASISLSSPALTPGPESISTLPATYTCDGKDTWPPLKWSGVPAGTAELALFALNLEPVDEALFFDWALAGIDPSSEGTESGQLPKGAVVGRNSFGKNGYSICPAGDRETVIFALYALPQDLGARTGFDPATLRKQILASSGNSGLLAVSYGRE